MPVFSGWLVVNRGNRDVLKMRRDHTGDVSRLVSPSRNLASGFLGSGL